jgi:co-chaperonin GroES (HSP10)
VNPTALYDGVDTRTMSDEAILDRLEPRGARIIVTRPDVAVPHESYITPGGIHVPDEARRVLREWGLIAKVLKVSSEVKEIWTEIAQGDIVLVTEFAGVPLYLGRETPYWIIGVGDVLCRVGRDDE